MFLDGVVFVVVSVVAVGRRCDGGGPTVVVVNVVTTAHAGVATAVEKA